MTIQADICEPSIDARDRHFFPPESETSMLDTALLLASQKRFIIRFVSIAAVLATGIAFLLPVRYEAKVVLLPPQQNSSIGSSLLGQLGGMGGLGSLASLASTGLGLKNPSDTYVSLLTSRTVEDAMIQRFSLMKEYDEKKLTDTRKEFEKRTTVIAGAKDGLIRIAVEDRNPERAAELANGYIEEFRKLSASLAITEAARRRLFFEQQLQQAKDNLSAAEVEMAKTQQSTGVLQIDSQARSLIESAAILRAQVVAKQVQIEGMRSFATDDNPQMLLAKQELTALRAQLTHLAGSEHDDGSDINLSKGRVTESGMKYVSSYRNLKYQETVFELLAKEFEIAKLDEAREGSIVQVVDPAVVPDKKSSPHRLLIIFSTVVLSFFLALLLIFVRRKLAHTLELPENQIRLAAIRQQWRSKQDQL